MAGEWWTKTWNPISGCSPVSEGCRNCWAKRMARRMAGWNGYPEGDGFAPTFHRVRLDEPLHWRKPQVVFACGMGDLFHEGMRPEWIDAVLAVIALSARHTYMILTKRPKLWAFNYLTLSPAAGWWRDELGQAAWEHFGENAECAVANAIEGCLADGLNVWWPMRNLWLGVSVEDQATADERIPWLLRTPAAHRFVSYEPALGPVDLRWCEWCGSWGDHECEAADGDDTINLFIAGGETGPGARPAHPDWFRSVRDQCAAAGVPFHFKQWGEWAPNCLCDTKRAHRTVKRPEPGKPGCMFRCGHEAAGRLLDGVEHNAGPHLEERR